MQTVKAAAHLGKVTYRRAETAAGVTKGAVKKTVLAVKNGVNNFDDDDGDGRAEGGGTKPQFQIRANKTPATADSHLCSFFSKFGRRSLHIGEYLKIHLQPEVVYYC